MGKMQQIEPKIKELELAKAKDFKVLEQNFRDLINLFQTIHQIKITQGPQSFYSVTYQPKQYKENEIRRMPP